MLLWLKNLGQAGGVLQEAPVRGPAFGVQSAIHLGAGAASMLTLGVGIGSSIHGPAGLSVDLTDSPVAVKSELE